MCVAHLCYLESQVRNGSPGSADMELNVPGERNVGQEPQVRGKTFKKGHGCLCNALPDTVMKAQSQKRAVLITQYQLSMSLLQRIVGGLLC